MKENNKTLSKKELPLIETNRKHLSQLIKYIREKQWVFIYGPNGMGKTKIIKTATPSVNKFPNYKCYYFNFEAEIGKGALSFYNSILKSIGINDSELMKESKNLSNEFIKKFITFLDNNEHIPVLFFDGLGAIDKYLYNQFAIDCRKIYSDRFDNKKTFDVIMIFAGSIVSSGNIETSPLWNITEQLRLYPICESESLKLIKEFFKDEGFFEPFNKLIEFINTQTKGHIFLIRAFTRFFLNENRFLNIDKYPDYQKEFIDENWTAINMLVNYENKTVKHFRRLIDYFIESSEMIHIALLALDKSVISQTQNTKIDHITITGLFTYQDNNGYVFSNIIYKDFISKLFHEHLKGDFCLHHSQNLNLWKLAKSCFVPFSKRDRRDYNFADVLDISTLINKLKNRLKTFDSPKDLIKELDEIFEKFFNIKEWGIYKCKKQKKNKIDEISIQEDWFIKNIVNNEKWISENEIIHQNIIINESVIKRTEIVDWIGNVIFIPVIIREDFIRLFIGRIENLNETIKRGITNFVTDALTVYYYLIKKEEAQRSYKKITETFTKSMGDFDKLKKEKDPSHETYMDYLWIWSKPIVAQTGITEYTYYQVFEDNTAISTPSKSDVLLTVRGKITNQYIIDAARSVANFGQYNDSKTNNYYLGGKLSNNVVIMFEFSMSNEDYKIKSHRLRSFFNLLYFLINSKILEKERLNTFRMSLNSFDDYLYIIDTSNKIIFINEKLKKFINNSDFLGKECYKFLMNRESECDQCPINNIIQGKRPVKLIRDLWFFEEKYVMNCSFVPIIDNDNVIAVAVLMHDISFSHKLWDIITEMEKIKDVNIMDTFILNALYEIGSKRVFRYKHDKKNQGLFISEDYVGEIKNNDEGNNFKNGKVSFTSKDFDTLMGRVSVWYKEDTNQNTIKPEISEKLIGSGFELKSIKIDKLKSNSEKTISPKYSDFWITIPIMKENSVEKLYAIDNNNDYELDIEILSIDKLQQIETFVKTANSIRENIIQRDYLKNILRMLSHGTMEPLGILRSSLYAITNMEDTSLKKQFGDTANVALGLVQASLGSVLTVERGQGRIHKETINIKNLVEKQTSLFKVYAMNFTGIEFVINSSGDNFNIFTDKIVLIQILNNLIGNSLKHLQKIKKRNNKRIDIFLKCNEDNIIIEISDNGEGLPPDVINFFNDEYKKGLKTPQGGLGLAYSREMASMIGGELKLLAPTSGTKFQLLI